jgi:thiol-disulfide isomerase/thioredoxin
MEIIKSRELKDLIKSNLYKITLLYFYSFTCQTCFIQLPQLENSIKNNNNIFLHCIDIDCNQKIVEDMDITSIPLLQIYKDVKKGVDFYGTDITIENYMDTINYLLLNSE